MATIVRHKETESAYVLLGTAAAAWAAGHPATLTLNHRGVRDAAGVEAVAVCDANGQVGFVQASEIQVVLVDGEPPGVILGRYA
ncbi:MAG: hypothetical protein AAF654_13510 [Myxococcota bacterium]